MDHGWSKVDYSITTGLSALLNLSLIDIAEHLVIGAHQGSIFAKDTRNPVQPSDPSSEDKRGQ